MIHIWSSHFCLEQVWFSSMQKDLDPNATIHNETSFKFKFSLPGSDVYALIILLLMLMVYFRKAFPYSSYQFLLCRKREWPAWESRGPVLQVRGSMEVRDTAVDSQVVTRLLSYRLARQGCECWAFLRQDSNHPLVSHFVEESHGLEGGKKWNEISCDQRYWLLILSEKVIRNLLLSSWLMSKGISSISVQPWSGIFPFFCEK